jgi:tRNA uridine 5-carboxymethylaminomethyl modification enzyme
MFTSRAEFRLQLREDNADLRLTEVGRGLGLVDDVRWDAFSRHRDRLAAELERLRGTWLRPATLAATDAERLLGKSLEHEYSLAELLRRPEDDHDAVCHAAAAARVEPVVSRETLRAAWGAREADRVIEQAEVGIKYAGYIDKQIDDVARAASLEALALPEDLDYSAVTALSFEVRQTLARQRPSTLGQASRISGVTPAAVSLLLVHLKKRRVRVVVSEQVEPAPARDEAA